jgi:hypothetical protein
MTTAQWNAEYRKIMQELADVRLEMLSICEAIDELLQSLVRRRVCVSPVTERLRRGIAPLMSGIEARIERLESGVFSAPACIITKEQYHAWVKLEEKARAKREKA